MGNIIESAGNLPQFGKAPTGTAEAEDEGQRFLTFLLGDGVFGMGIQRIKEILEYGAMTQVPMAPPVIRGVINLRGNVVPVINLAARIGKVNAEVGKRTCIIIIEMLDDEETVDLGFVVDAVDEVVLLAAGQIEGAPAFGAEIEEEFIDGIGKVNGRFVTLLEPEKVLSVEDLSVLVEGFMS